MKGCALLFVTMLALCQADNTNADDNSNANALRQGVTKPTATDYESQYQQSTISDQSLVDPEERFGARAHAHAAAHAAAQAGGYGYAGSRAAANAAANAGGYGGGYGGGYAGSRAAANAAANAGGYGGGYGGSHAAANAAAAAGVGGHNRYGNGYNRYGSPGGYPQYPVLG